MAHTFGGRKIKGKIGVEPRLMKTAVQNRLLSLILNFSISDFKSITYNAYLTLFIAYENVCIFQNSGLSGAGQGHCWSCPASTLPEPGPPGPTHSSTSPCAAIGPLRATLSHAAPSSRSEAPFHYRSPRRHPRRACRCSPACGVHQIVRGLVPPVPP